MAAKAALAILVLTLLLGGCAMFSESRPAPAPTPAAMPLTSDNVGQVRAAVVQAKSAAGHPQAKDDYIRYARLVYAGSLNRQWSPAATTETALAKAKAGDAAAREYLTVMVYDLQLQAAMEGASLSAEDWHDIYVGSGLMSEAGFSGYAAMRRGGRVLP